MDSGRSGHRSGEVAVPAADTLPRHAPTRPQEDPAADRVPDDLRVEEATGPVPGAAPIHVSIPRNANLQSGHPGPHALECLDGEPAGPPHVPDPPHATGAAEPWPESGSGPAAPVRRCRARPRR